MQSVVRAWNIDDLKRSAQYTPPVDYVGLDVFTQAEKAKQESNAKSPLAQRGFLHVPATEGHGGVLVHGEIRRDVTVNLIALRRLSGDEEPLLRRYILGLALVAVTAEFDGFLRQGCLLTPDPDVPATWQSVGRDGVRQSMTLSSDMALRFAQGAAQTFGVGANCKIAFDRQRAKADAKSVKAGAKRKNDEKEGD